MKIRLAPAALLAGAVAAAGAPDTGRVTDAPETMRSAPPGNGPAAPTAPAAPAVPVAPETVVRQLSREGYYGFRRIARERDRYVVHAFSRGRLMRIVADAGSGRILGARVLAPAGAENPP